MSVFIETPDKQLEAHHIFDYMYAIFKGFSWLALIVAPWSLLAFFLHGIGIVNLSSPELLFISVMLLSAVPQLILNRQRN